MVSDPEHPDGENRLVLLRVQHEGASGECFHPPLVPRPSEYYFLGALTFSGTYAQPSALADLNADARLCLESQNASLTTYNIQLDYSYWKAGSLDVPLCECFSKSVVSLDEILHAILPEQLLDGSPTGFSMMGHLGRRRSYSIELCHVA